MRVVLIHFFLNCLSIAANCTPRFILAFFCQIARFFWYWCIRYRRALVLNNLRHAYGNEKTESEIRRLAFKNLGHYIFFGIEFIQLATLSPKRFKRKIRFENIEFLQKAFEEKKGVVLLNAHLGNFEWAAAGASILGCPLYVVARIMKNPIMESWISGKRKKWGIREISPQNAKWSLFRLLRKNQLVGFMMDQRKSPPDGVFVDFFGRPAGTTQGLAYLIERTGAVVLPAYNYRTDFGNIVVRFDQPLSYKRVGTRRENIYYNTQIYTSVVEKMVREYPEQWFWIHDRWKGSPKTKSQFSSSTVYERFQTI